MKAGSIRYAPGVATVEKRRIGTGTKDETQECALGELSSMACERQWVAQATMEGQVRLFPMRLPRQSTVMGRRGRAGGGEVPSLPIVGPIIHLPPR